MMDTQPCPECLERYRARRAQYDWTRDPAMGICPKCSALLVVNAEGNLDPCVYEHDGAARESDPEYARLARVPQHYADCRVGNWEPQTGHPRQQIAAYCATWPPIAPVLLLTGLPGTGKTHLAIGAMFLLRQRHGDRALARFWPVIDLLERFRRTFDADRATETIEQAEDSLRRVPVLVLDDFGAHKSSEWAEERLFHLIDSRYSAGKVLIVTTNMTLQELPARVKSRLASGSVVNFANLPDRRLAS